MNLLDLPDCMIEQIFECLSYDEIAKKRLVSTKINSICQQLLNRGFTKALLPRRESERRNHPLIKHADTLTCIETRLSMLTMTYTKYIEMDLCCFIPGKIIDETLSVLRLVKSTDVANKQLRAHEVLQELRDISSMAIDHFDEKIVNILKKSFCDFTGPNFNNPLYQILNPPRDAPNVTQPEPLGPSCDTDTTPKASTSSQCQDDTKSRRAYLRLNKKYKSVMKKLNHVASIQTKQLRVQRTFALQMCQMNSQILNMRRRLEETESKNREIAANFNQLAVWEQADTSGNQIFTRTVTKPRVATIILKRRINEQVPPLKRIMEE